MLETPARVIDTQGDMARVEADYGGGCGGSQCARGGCGAALLAQLFTRNPRARLTVLNPIGARPGERVVVGVEEGSVLAATLRVYLLPLVFLLAGALLSRSLGGGDALAAAGALAGLVLGWATARILGRRTTRAPAILRRL
jgi:sigma-E factor negative regulatory protein RseC